VVALVGSRFCAAAAASASWLLVAAASFLFWSFDLREEERVRHCEFIDT
jgi:hypothetical protein